MAFESGHKKLGGRQKGTPNKHTQAKNLIKEHLDIEYIIGLIEDFKRPEDKVSAYLKLLSFAYPKPKAIEPEPEQMNEFIIRLIDSNGNKVG